ncbi:hypothetical protein D3C77_602900 [compost metagenome]
MLRLAQVFRQQLTRAGQGQLCTAVLQVLTGLAQGIQMAPTGTETTLCRLFITHAGLQVVAQQLQPCVVPFGAEGDRHMAVIALFQRYPLTTQVGLVANQRDLGRVWPLVEKFWPQGERVAGLGRGGIHHQQHTVCLANGLQRTFHADLFHMVIGVAQTGSIDHV